MTLVEETFGEILRRRRRELGVSQLQLAEQLGCSAGAVSFWETDQREPLDPAHILNALERVAEKFPSEDRQRKLPHLQLVHSRIEKISGRLAKKTLKVVPNPHHPPKTRGECEGGPRPCPMVSCRYNLFLDVRATGSVQLNHPTGEPEDMVQSCALDVAEEGGATLEEIASYLNVTREAVRQMEAKALVSIEQRDRLLGAALRRAVKP